MYRGALGLTSLVFLYPLAAADTGVDFNRDVRPILSDKCFTCHGPDSQTRMVKLRLDTREGVFADRGGERIIIPGDPSASRLYQRVSHEQAALRMPPRGAGEPMTPEQIETIRQWIEQGARWNKHWAFESMKPVEPPDVADPL
ncbi:MAG: hypothetical protein GY953_20240, partial [bacterium]|nr:hypothetical protein [bacterium]